MINYNKEKNKLITIRERYFRPTIKYPNGDLVHHALCKIYQPKQIYNIAPCTCGLLHDINWLDCDIAEKIYYNWYIEDVLSELTYEEEQNYHNTKEERELANEEITKLIKDVFGTTEIPPKDIKEDKQEWKIIEKVFGKEFRIRKQKEYEQSNKADV